jgi:uncharacterized protein (DUF2147 family)
MMNRSAVAIFRIVSLAFVALGAFDANAAQPAEVVGVWLSPKANMRVRISPCGAALCGNMDGPNGVKMEACSLAGLLCQSQTWTPVN